jgi:hypothetical protein
MQKQIDPTARIGLAGVLFIYLCLVIPSNLTHSFVVYGRLARQLMPFLVLAAADGLRFLDLLKPRIQWLINILILFLFAQAAWNYHLSYLLVYPREFASEVQTKYPDFEISSKMMQFYAPSVCQDNGYLAANFHYLYDLSQPVPQVYGKVLLRAAHPVNFLPYQYEGYSPEQRIYLRRQDYEMIFYSLDRTDQSDAPMNIENCNQGK